ncbi:MAG: ABC transporter ATP-binding protein [Candidatus Pacebacteria bacterium]|nr:ABC transporter ATP-binding protein [Candidatus Paceibacterota bacterium]
MNLYLKTKFYYLRKSLIYLKNYKKLAFLVVIFSLLSSLFDGFSISAIIPFFQNLISESANPLFPAFENIQKYLIHGEKVDVLIKLLIFALVMIIFRSIFNYLKTITLEKTRNFIKRDLQNNIFNAVSDSSLKFFYSMKSGEIVTNINVFTNSIVSFIFVLLNLISNLSKITVYGIILFFISWKLTVAIFFFYLFFFPFIRNILNKVKRTGQALTEEAKNLNSRMIEMLGSIPLVKISGTEDLEKNRFSKITKNIALFNYNQSKQTNFIPFIMETFVMASIITLILFSSKILLLDVIASLPFIIAYLYIFLRLFSETNIFLQSISGMFEHAPAFKNYENELNTAKKMKIKEGEQIIKSFKEKILFKNICFSYEKNRPVINNLNFEIKKGDFIALVGPTGTGKSTIANLLAGLFLPDSGEIFIDSKEIRELNLKNWRKKIGFISQDIIIFNDTVLNNILYGSSEKNTEKDAKNAAKIANIDKFIENLPQKYETILGERGVKLSGGQKQRIAIARVILRNPEILILDEATSSLDAKTEKTIQDSLEKARSGRTVLAIAHRLSTIIKADKIIVINKGQVAESGTHEELINKDGIYKKYYDLQFKN